jgi:NADH:ubiquinone oxidoreductase subunit H
MLMAMYSTLAERKVAAWLQDRIGPNRAGKGGLLQPLADGLKLFAKEEFEPDTQTAFIFTGPAIAMTTALMTSDPLGIDFIFSARISYYRQLTLMLLYFTLLAVNRCVRNYDWWMGI